MDLSALVSLMIAITVLAWKPGAGFFLTMSITLRHGFYTALVFVFGAALGDAVFFYIAYKSISIDAQIMDFFVILIKSIGATYLIWYGLKGLAQKEFVSNKKDQLKKEGIFQTLFTGVLFTFSNPLAIIFYMAFIPTILDLELLNIFDVAMALAVVVVWGTFSYCTLSWTAMAFGKSFIKDQKALKRTNFVTSIIIVIIGLMIGWSAFPIIDFQKIYFGAIELFNGSDINGLQHFYS